MKVITIGEVDMREKMGVKTIFDIFKIQNAVHLVEITSDVFT